MGERVKWTEEHQEEVFRFYMEREGLIPDKGAPAVVSIARNQKRTPSSVVYKMSNYRFLDPVAEENGPSGFDGFSRQDLAAWKRLSGRGLSKRALAALREKGWLRSEEELSVVTLKEFGAVDANFSSVFEALLAKPFTILTGASGTGKTKVAESLAKALANEDESNSAVVAVGSDWTDSRNVLGFVNHLREGGDKLPIYQSTPILNLLLEAGAEGNEDLPYFLILDEMNLSHVERYFADFLSAMERSEGKLALHQEGDGATLLQRSPEQEGDVPQSLPYPQNLFVIGTVNIDETTYMFSPKVLDRANVIEFAVESGDLESFLAEPKDYVMAEKASAGMAEGFLALAKQARQLKDGLEDLPEGPNGKVDGHLLALFKILKAHRYEYGYRTAAEVTSETKGD